MSGTSSTVQRADDLLIETIDKLLEEHATPERIGAAEGGLDAPLWKLLEESGLTLVGVAEDRGGSGGTLYDLAAIVKSAGRHSAPVPLGDTLFGNATLAGFGALDVSGGAVAYAVVPEGATSVRVPWAGAASHIAVVSFPGGVVHVASVARADVTVLAEGSNYAGEPWLDIDVASLPADVPAAEGAGVTFADVRAAGALCRALLMAGACQRVVELSVQYAMEREQFGKPIGKFQILQHYLAEMAGEAAAAEAAADNAIDVIVSGAPRDEVTNACAAAKAYAGRAVATINRLAHQLHGAIGYTDEHRLQYWTRRLWAWRDEYGSEAEWAAHFGRSLATAGGAALWPAVTSWPPAIG